MLHHKVHLRESSQAWNSGFIQNVCHHANKRSIGCSNSAQEPLYLIRHRAPQDPRALDRRRAAHRDALWARAVSQQQLDEGNIARDARGVQRRHGAGEVLVEGEPSEPQLHRARHRSCAPYAHKLRVRKCACKQ